MGWNKPVSQYERYLKLQSNGERAILVAWVSNEFAGYLTVVWKPNYPGFRDNDIPEIQDMNVLPHFRRQHIATHLMDEAERLISERSCIVGIGVGLHPGYNAAQKMYPLRGYVPDAKGVTYDDVYITEGQTIIADDNLVLHMTKQLGESA